MRLMICSLIIACFVNFQTANGQTLFEKAASQEEAAAESKRRLQTEQRRTEEQKRARGEELRRSINANPDFLSAEMWSCGNGFIISSGRRMYFGFSGSPVRDPINVWNRSQVPQDAQLWAMPSASKVGLSWTSRTPNGKLTRYEFDEVAWQLAIDYGGGAKIQILPCSLFKAVGKSSQAIEPRQFYSDEVLENARDRAAGESLRSFEELSFFFSEMWLCPRPIENRSSLVTYVPGYTYSESFDGIRIELKGSNDSIFHADVGRGGDEAQGGGVKASSLWAIAQTQANDYASAQRRVVGARWGQPGEKRGNEFGGVRFTGLQIDRGDAFGAPFIKPIRIGEYLGGASELTWMTFRESSGAGSDIRYRFSRERGQLNLARDGKREVFTCSRVKEIGVR